MTLIWQLLGSRGHGKGWQLDSASPLSIFSTFSSMLSPSGKTFLKVIVHVFFNMAMMGRREREREREGGRRERE